MLSATIKDLSRKYLLFGKSKCCYLWYTYTELISFGCSRLMNILMFYLDTMDL